MESRKSKIDTDVPGQASKSHLAFFFSLFFITIIISIFIPSFVINKNRYIVVWAAAWRQTNRKASNYSSNSSSSNNSRVVIIGSGIMCTCTCMSTCACVRFLCAPINTARAANMEIFRYNTRAGIRRYTVAMLVLICIFDV